MSWPSSPTTAKPVEPTKRQAEAALPAKDLWAHRLNALLGFVEANPYLTAEARLAYLEVLEQQARLRGLIRLDGRQ